MRAGPQGRLAVVPGFLEAALAELQVTEIVQRPTGLCIEPDGGSIRAARFTDAPKRAAVQESLDAVKKLDDVAQVADPFDPRGGAVSRDGRIASADDYDEAQQQHWFAFVKALKVNYPAIETLGGRLAQFIQDGGHAAG